MGRAPLGGADDDRRARTPGRDTANAFLSRVCSQLRKERPLVDEAIDHTIGVETVSGAAFARLWFRTQGCSRDREGSCTACNYGRCPVTSPEAMVAAAQRGLDRLRTVPPQALLVSPSGSMLDDVEVPVGARRRILGLVAASGISEITCEARAEDVTPGKLAELSSLLRGKQVHVEMGLESSDPWVLRFSVNKRLSPAGYARALTQVREYGVRSVSNVLLGSPFLSESEAMLDAIRTIRWALDHDSAACVLFPVHVRRWTFVEWLWRHNLYRPPSLWSLIGVLARLGPVRARRVSISWYRAYPRDENAPPDSVDPTAPIASPTTCPRCIGAVLDSLDRYRDTGDFTEIERLEAHCCVCHERWHTELTEIDPETVVARAVAGYTAAGTEVLGEPWWVEHGPEVIQDVAGSRPWTGEARREPD